MEKLLEILAWCVANYEALFSGLAALCLAIDAILMVLPGQDPVIFKKIAEFLSKFSVKKVSLGSEKK